MLERVIMKDDDELEMLLNEIPRVTSLHQHHQQEHDYGGGYVDVHVHGGDVHGGDGDGFSPQHRIHEMFGVYDADPSYNHHQYNCVSPASGVTLQSEGSSWSFPSVGFSSDDGSTTPHTLGEISSQRPNQYTHFSNGLSLGSRSLDSPLRGNVVESLIDSRDLVRNLGGLHISDEQGSNMNGSLPKGSYGFQFSNGASHRTNNGYAERNGLFDDHRNAFADNEGLTVPFPLSSMISREERASRLGCENEYRMSNVSSSPFHYSSLRTDRMSSPQQQMVENAPNVISRNLQLQANVALGSNCYHRVIPNTAPFTTTRLPITDALLCSHHNLMDLSGVRGISSCNNSMVSGRTGEARNCCIHKTLSAMRGVNDIDAFNCEGSLILQGTDVSCLIRKRYTRSKEGKKGSYSGTGISRSTSKSSELSYLVRSRGVYDVNYGNGSTPKTFCASLLPRKYSSLSDVKGYIYFLAKDQNGCRFLQKKLDEPTPQNLQMIFKETINHVVELMMNPFGNYLMQRLLDVCNEEHRTRILQMVTSEPGKLVQISLNMHGTRSVQKLIETLKTRQQISLVISALEPRFLALIKDLNGNHVVHCCLQVLGNEDKEFIFKAAAKFCIEIATHQHGCRVLQQCITHSSAEHRNSLVDRISANGLLLAQDTFGNYVIQYILDPKISRSAISNLSSQFQGNYVYLSTQKFSSNVVEKCLEVFDEQSRTRIIHELLSASRFEQLLHDPYANYVIQSALRVSKGSLYLTLVESIRGHASRLKSCPHCKRIFPRILSKK